MGRRGPAATPTPILKARGSWRAKLREGEPVVDVHEEIPEPPKFLKGEALKCWNRTAQELVKMKVLAASDVDQLAQYCRTFADWIVCDDKHLRMKMEASLRMDRRELGLSPSARTRVKTEKPAAVDDKAAKYFGGLKVAK